MFQVKASEISCWDNTMVNDKKWDMAQIIDSLGKYIKQQAEDHVI